MADQVIDKDEATTRERSFEAAPKKFNVVTFVVVIVVIAFAILAALLIGGFFNSGRNAVQPAGNPASSQSMP